MCTVRDGFLVSGFVAVDDAGENAGGVAKLLPDGEAYRKKKCFTKMHQNDDLTFQKRHFFLPSLNFSLSYGLNVAAPNSSSLANDDRNPEQHSSLTQRHWFARMHLSPTECFVSTNWSELNVAEPTGK